MSNALSSCEISLEMGNLTQLTQFMKFNISMDTSRRRYYNFTEVAMGFHFFSETTIELLSNLLLNGAQLYEQLSNKERSSLGY